MIQRIKEWASQFDQMTDEEFWQYLLAKLQQAISAIKGWSRRIIANIKGWTRRRKIVVGTFLFYTLWTLAVTIKDMPIARPFLIQWAVNFAAGPIIVFYTAGMYLVFLGPFIIVIALAVRVARGRRRGA